MKLAGAQLNPGWLRIKQACQYCGIGERTLRTWLSEGLPYSKVKGVVLIKVEKLDQFLKGFEVKENEIDHLVNEVLSDL